MAKLTNLGEPCSLFRPEADPESMFVDTDQTIEVPGDARDVGDAWVIGERAYGKERWELADEQTADTSASTAASTASATTATGAAASASSTPASSAASTDPPAKAAPAAGDTTAAKEK